MSLNGPVHPCSDFQWSAQRKTLIGAILPSWSAEWSRVAASALGRLPRSPTGQATWLLPEFHNHSMFIVLHTYVFCLILEFSFQLTYLLTHIHPTASAVHPLCAAGLHTYLPHQKRASTLSYSLLSSPHRAPPEDGTMSGPSVLGAVTSLNLAQDSREGGSGHSRASHLP